MPKASCILLLLLLALIGCGHDDGHDHQGHEHQGHEHHTAGETGMSSCEASAGECFQIGWEGTSNVARLTVVGATPEEPTRGLNSWQMMLSDLEGNALSGCELALTPFMPEHDHGVATTPEVTEGEAGQYQIDQIELIMPGLWDMRFEISCEGWDMSEKITYSIWLPA